MCITVMKRRKKKKCEINSGSKYSTRIYPLWPRLLSRVLKWLRCSPLLQIWGCCKADWHVYTGGSLLMTASFFLPLSLHSTKRKSSLITLADYCLDWRVSRLVYEMSNEGETEADGLIVDFFFKKGCRSNSQTKTDCILLRLKLAEWCD